jgi:hypothetical protein
MMNDELNSAFRTCPGAPGFIIQHSDMDTDVHCCNFILCTNACFLPGIRFSCQADFGSYAA